LTSNGHLDSDSGMLFIGPAAERRYGRKNFLELLSVFISDPEFVVLHGRTDIGSVDPIVLTRKVVGPRLISLAGRAWKVTYIDWKRRRTYVEPSDQAGVSRWSSAPQPLSYELTDAIRRVLLGAAPAGVALSKRAVTQLAGVRTERAATVDESCSIIAMSDNGQLRWWTYAGARANAVLATALTTVDPTLVDEVDRFDNRYLRLRGDASAAAVQSALRSAGSDFGHVLPSVSEQAVKQLKFAELLPPAMAMQTLAERGADSRGAARLAARAVVEGHR